MNTFTIAKAIALSLAIGLAHAATAESFNDRGEDFLTQVKPGPQPPSAGVVLTQSHFNDQGEDFLTQVKPGSRVSHPAVVMSLSHFNDRGDADQGMAPVITGASPLTAGAAISSPVVHTTAAGS